jgi:hypothetical protein
MSLYRVRWDINIDAETPREAAERALEIQRDPESIALVFGVRDPRGQEQTIDLWQGPKQEVAQ